jgi:hypothetical protein
MIIGKWCNLSAGLPKKDCVKLRSRPKCRFRRRDGRVVEGTRLENEKRPFAHFLTRLPALYLLTFFSILTSSRIRRNLLEKDKQYQIAVSDFDDKTRVSGHHRLTINRTARKL